MTQKITGYDLWISKYPLLKFNGLYYYDTSKSINCNNINCNIFHISTEQSIFSTICWEHLPNKNWKTWCHCPKEPLWHVTTDFHNRLGSDIFKRTKQAIDLLNQYEIFARSGQGASQIELFCYILEGFKGIAKEYPNHLFGILDYERNTHTFITDDNQEMEIEDAIQFKIVPEIKDKRRTKFIPFYEFGGTFLNNKKQ